MDVRMDSGIFCELSVIFLQGRPPCRGYIKKKKIKFVGQLGPTNLMGRRAKFVGPDWPTNLARGPG